MADEDEARQRYQRVLDEFSRFTREFQDYKLAREQAVNDLERRLIEQVQIYWKATAAALRQLSEWQATNEDAARKERTAERTRRNWQAWIIIGLLLVLIIGGALALLLEGIG